MRVAGPIRVRLSQRKKVDDNRRFSKYRNKFIRHRTQLLFVPFTPLIQQKTRNRQRVTNSILGNSFHHVQLQLPPQVRISTVRHVKRLYTGPTAHLDDRKTAS